MFPLLIFLFESLKLKFYRIRTASMTAVDDSLVILFQVDRYKKKLKK